MHKGLILFLLILSIGTTAQDISIIPKPASIVETKEESFQLGKTLRIYNGFANNNPSHPLLRYLSDFLGKNYQIKVLSAEKTEAADLSFESKQDQNLSISGYRLNVNKHSIVIESNSEEGAFYGLQSFLQLLPAAANKQNLIPAVAITDAPRFEYRGMHLDVGRHFYPITYVKQYIDYLALHKINRFHWHLTEDQGWRIEIKKYPALTEKGAWRNGTIIGRYPGTGNNNQPYGGFYTQDEIREVVQYAKDRYIDVIPEIEMPGHSSAAIAAYPWLSCFPDQPTAIPANMISEKSKLAQQQGQIKLVQETWGIFDDVFCAGKESTFEFLQNVIDEVITLFPGKYFHIGGDECPKAHWKKCTACQQRMREQGLKDEHELQSYFIQRIEKYLNSKGKTLIGWDEILEGGLAPNAVVMSWRGEKGGIEAAKEKHGVIMTPGKPVYFDHSQSKLEDSVTIGGYNPIEAVYAYDPIPKELNAEEARYVLGAQANVWTEYMNNTKKIEYMIFPRMAALSEVLWTAPANKDWKAFEARLEKQMQRYDFLGIHYSKAYYEPNIRFLPGSEAGKITMSVSSKNAALQFRAANKNAAGKESSLVTSGKDAFEISESGDYILISSIHNQPIHRFEQPIRISKATNVFVSLKQNASNSYPGDGAFTLVNGMINTKGMMRSNEFLGFSGSDCEAILDFKLLITLNEVKVHGMEQHSSWIYAPKDVEVFTSNDGINFEAVETSLIDIKKQPRNPAFAIGIGFKAKEARYMKVVVKNAGTIEAGYPGAGNKAWLFVSELEVN